MCYSRARSHARLRSNRGDPSRSQNETMVLEKVCDDCAATLPEEGLSPAARSTKHGEQSTGEILERLILHGSLQQSSKCRGSGRHKIRQHAQPRHTLIWRFLHSAHPLRDFLCGRLAGMLPFCSGSTAAYDAVKASSSAGGWVCSLIRSCPVVSFAPRAGRMLWMECRLSLPHGVCSARQGTVYASCFVLRTTQRNPSAERTGQDGWPRANGLAGDTAYPFWTPTQMHNIYRATDLPALPPLEPDGRVRVRRVDLGRVEGPGGTLPVREL